MNIRAQTSTAADAITKELLVEVRINNHRIKATTQVNSFMQIPTPHHLIWGSVPVSCNKWVCNIAIYSKRNVPWKQETHSRNRKQLEFQVFFFVFLFLFFFVLFFFFCGVGGGVGGWGAGGLSSDFRLVRPHQWPSYKLLKVTKCRLWPGWPQSLQSVALHPYFILSVYTD